MSNAKLRYAQLREAMKPGDFLAYCQKGERDGDGWKVCDEVFTDRAEFETHFTKVHRLRFPRNNVGNMRPRRWKPPTQRPLPAKWSTSKDLLESSDWIDPDDLRPGMRVQLVGATLGATYTVLGRNGDTVTMRQEPTDGWPERVGDFSTTQLRDLLAGHWGPDQRFVRLDA